MSVESDLDNRENICHFQIIFNFVNTGGKPSVRIAELTMAFVLTNDFENELTSISDNFSSMI